MTAEQGIFSITENGKTKFKLICGCNGESVLVLKRILSQPIESAESLLELALSYSIGCELCTHVMDDTKTINKRGECPDIPERYRSTFDDPLWNPRYEDGEADYVAVIEAEIFNKKA